MMTTRSRMLIILATTLVVALSCVGILVFHISGPRMIARTVAPDGTEMCIVQQCNWSAEPFTTSFVFRKPGGSWGRFYFDHEDIYWRSSQVSLDADSGVAVFNRGSSPAVTFAWATETYTMHPLNRTMIGA